MNVTTGKAAALCLYRSMLLLLAVLASSAPVYGQRTFELMLPGIQPAQSSTIASTPDDGFLVLARLQANEERSHIALVRLSGTGEVEWGREYSLDSCSVEPHTLTLLPGGDILVTGLIDSPEKKDLLVLRLTGMGSIRWTKVYGAVPGSYRNSVSLQEDGTVVLSGSNALSPPSSSEPDERPLVVRLDSNGIPLWTKEVVSDDSIYATRTAFPFCGESNGMLSGIVRLGPPDNHLKEVSALLRLNPDGTVRSAYLLEHTSLGFVHDLVPAPKGGMFVLSSVSIHDPPSFYNRNFDYLLKLDTEFRGEWGRLYEKGYWWEHLSLFSLPKRDRMLLAREGYDRTLAIADGDGRILKGVEWQPFIDNDSIAIANTSDDFFSLTHDGGMAIVGHVDSVDSDWDGMLVARFASDLSTCGGKSAEAGKERGFENTASHDSIALLENHPASLLSPIPLRTVPFDLDVRDLPGMIVTEIDFTPLLLCRQEETTGDSSKE